VVLALTPFFSAGTRREGEAADEARRTTSASLKVKHNNKVVL
jgi:hypothetical protein